MAYIGGCNRHGNYVDYCGECVNEQPLHTLVELIKGGMEPDAALKKVLDDTLEAKRREELERMRRESMREIKAIRRQQAISDFLSQHPELNDDIAYG